MVDGILVQVESGRLQLTDSTTSDLSFWADGEADHPAVQLARLYGSVPKAMMTLFMAVSGGMDWIDAARPVTQQGPFFVALWTIYVLFMVFVLLNLLFGVLVDSAMQSAGIDRDQQVRESLREEHKVVQRLTQILLAADTDMSGYIDKAEFESMLCQPEAVFQLHRLGIDTVSMQTLLTSLDTHHTGHVSFEEFITGCLRLKGNATSADMVALLQQGQRSHHKVNVILKEIRKLHSDMNSMLRISHTEQGPAASFSPEICPMIPPLPADRSEPWLQAWNRGSAVDLQAAG